MDFKLPRIVVFGSVPDPGSLIGKQIKFLEDRYGAQPGYVFEVVQPYTDEEVLWAEDSAGARIRLREEHLIEVLD